MSVLSVFRNFILPLCLLVSSFEPVLAESEEETIRVAVREIAPFAYKNAAGDWTGLSVDLWKAIAVSQDWKTEWVPVDSPKAQVLALVATQADVAVGALSMTSEREVIIDFSHSFFSANLAIATPQQKSGWLNVIKQVFSMTFVKAVGALSLLLFAVGAAIWLVERRKNVAQFGGSTLQGLGNGFWWSAVTMTTVGYGDKVPVSTAGRVIATFWMFFSVITISGYTASIASSITLENQKASINSVHDLAQARTVVVSGSTGADKVSALGISATEVSLPEEGVRQLETAMANAFVYDDAVLRFLLSKSDLQTSLIAIPHTSQNYAFGLSPQFKHREAINRRILEVTSGADWRSVQRTYFGD